MKEIFMIMSYHLYILIYPEKNLNPLKNLKHHDKNPAAPVQGNNLMLMKKHNWSTENISTSSNKILQPHPW